MAMQKSQLWGSDSFALYWLVDYHKYWIDKDQGIKNPHFTQEESGRILSLKDESHWAHQKAVAFFSRALSAEFKAMNPRTNIEVVLVPSSKEGKVSSGMDQVARTACKNNSSFQYKPNAFRRHTTIKKLAHGGDRGLDVHLNSIEYQSTESLCPVMLLDDVCTTGNSFVACFNLIRMQQPFRPIFAVALGRTVDE